MTFGSVVHLFQALYAYDNTQEPTPTWNRPETIYGTVGSFNALAVLCVGFRLWLRARMHCLGWDDVFITLAKATGTIGTLLICLSVRDGLGQHFRYLSVDQMIHFQQKLYVAIATSTISAVFAKFCLLSQYLRIFDRSTLQWRLSMCGLFVVGTWGTIYSFMSFFPCFPVSGFWDWTSPAVCYGFGSKDFLRLETAFSSHVTTNLLLDIVILAIPFSLLSASGTTLKQRLALGALFAVGAMVSALSLWRLITIVQHRATTWPVVDPTWYGTSSMILACIEVDGACVCASIPVFWPVITRGLSRIFVTHEVQITRSNRRTSSDDPFELPITASSTRMATAGLRGHTPGGSEEECLKPSEYPDPDKMDMSSKELRRCYFQTSYAVPSGLEGVGEDAESWPRSALVVSEGTQAPKRQQRWLELPGEKR